MGRISYSEANKILASGVRSMSENVRPSSAPFNDIKGALTMDGHKSRFHFEDLAFVSLKRCSVLPGR